jgi:hypothetical protein
MRRFIPKLGLGFLGAAGLIALASDVGAVDHSIPAIAGRPWLPGDANCFTTGSFSNKVVNTCATARSWLVPITTHRHGIPINANHVVRASSTGAGTAPTCRFVHRTAGDAWGLLGDAKPVNGATINLGEVFITPSGGESLQVDCSLAPNGRGLTSVNWAIP